VTDRPILFSGPMVRALLAGTKTQTRRVISNKPRQTKVNLFDGTWSDSYVLDPGNQSWRDDAYPWRVGDRLYVREAWRAEASYDGTPPRELEFDSCMVRYEADGYWSDWDQMTHAGKFRQAMHMPRWASRLTLIVTDVRVQRLQEISEEDAKAEGMAGEFCDYELYGQSKPYRYEYCGLWDSLNADRGYGWDANPWVVAVSFTVERGGIDAVRP
jgi:hypothetical protein